MHEKREAEVKRLATSLQVHSCKGRGCLKRINSQLKCKRRAPFPCAPSAWVSEAGEWGPARLHAMVVAFHPEILLVLRCNHDIKILTNAYDTSGIGWYITLYATKKQQNAGNASAVLARRLAYHQQQQARDPAVDELNRKMINRCANALNREQEFSAPEIIGYLMGWGDRYISHHYVTVYWDNIVFSLKLAFPELQQSSHKQSLGLVDKALEAAETGEDATCSLRPSSGHMVVKMQSEEYAYRGEALEDMNFWDYFTETYDEREKPAASSAAERQIGYLPGSPRKGGRRVRLPGHETMLQFVGQWFPSRRDDDKRSLYQASMLALFKPWRSLEDLKGVYVTFDDAFTTFLAQCPLDVQRIMDNMEYYYLSAEAAKIDRPLASLGPVHRLADMDDETGDQENDTNHRDAVATESSITDEAIAAEHEAVYTAADRRFAKQAMLFAHTAGVFNANMTATSPWQGLSVNATYNDHSVYEAWDARLKEYMRHSKHSDSQSKDVIVDSLAPSSMFVPPTVLEGGAITTPSALSNLPLTLVLNSEQQRAHDIIRWHVTRTIDDKGPEQLLMIIDGQGGTGKSALIEAITGTMKALGVLQWLSKTATSGVAATRIGGTTTHSWAAIGTRSKKGGAGSAASHILKRRKDNMEHTRYLIIDEFSMLTKDLLESVSEVGSTGVSVTCLTRF
ncbi:hypothetical protein BDN71DRAFT_283261 [Pleurotus eryngii]|uniref:ATP-dependent DNA helicase n=1 Tax=Pleurotus eryngii TaxID=5323 RepID=A0A9P6DBP8_PLEER|nr:hypothetical protein BDN71DRAFT_283261 [Pleurotus eryngii]